MALKKDKAIKLDVTGLSIEDILNISGVELNRWTEKDLKAIANRLVSASNKRLKRLGASEIGRLSPEYTRYKGKKFSIKGMDRNQVRNYLVKLENFLRSQKSSISGWKKVRNKYIKRLGKFSSIENESKFWELYRKLEDKNGSSLLKNLDSFMIQDQLKQIMTDETLTEDDILSRMDDIINDLYIEKMKDEMDAEAVVMDDIFTF